MNKLNLLFSKFKNEKGVTGVDVVVSITVIAITIAIVTSIYINIDLTTKNVQRTAGATRIATNILEQIDKIYYEEFLAEIDRIKGIASDSSKKYISMQNDGSTEIYTIESKNTSEDVKVFETKIPKGYVTKISLKNAYGTDTINQYDIVRNITVEVSFNVGRNKESVDLSTAKAMEIVDVSNGPTFNDANYKFYSGVQGREVIPIKLDGEDYVVTDVDDKGWYNYENRNWAKIILDSSYYDSATKVVKEGFENVLYVWIPSYGKDEEGNLRFRYKFTKYRIKNKILEPKITGGSKRSIYTVDSYSPDLDNFPDADFGEDNGYWVKYTDISKNSYSKLLSESKYGPIDLQLPGK